VNSFLFFFSNVESNDRPTIRTDDLIVANDGVRRIISFACLYLAAEYGPLRSNSNRLARSCLKLHPVVALIGAYSDGQTSMLRVYNGRQCGRRRIAAARRFEMHSTAQIQVE
jgi:hypothetical protein